MIRELTQQEQQRCLSPAEIKQLQPGTRVFIKWSGGNGPHMYVVIFNDHSGEPDQMADRLDPGYIKDD